MLLSARERLIVAVDKDILFPSDLECTVIRLSGHVGMVRVGANASWFGIDRMLAIGAHLPIMVDMKLHDIRTFVSRIIARTVHHAHPPLFITVHASGTPAMLRAAAEAAEGITSVIGVCLTTDFDREECEKVYCCIPTVAVQYFAKRCRDAGLAGIMCSGNEVALIRQEWPEATIIVAGIRLSDTVVDDDDQERIVTPAKAIANGADYIIVGRPIMDQDDPACAADEIVRQIAETMTSP